MEMVLWAGWMSSYLRWVNIYVVEGAVSCEGSWVDATASLLNDMIFDLIPQ